MSEPVVLCWSGGKDSVLALHSLQNNPNYDVVGLLTTITKDDDRIAMHWIRRELLILQSEAIGIPLAFAGISKGAGNDEYERSMADAFLGFQNDGVTTVAFGDLFLKDIRQYREQLMNRIGMTTLFPIWKHNTADLAKEFVSLGFKAKVCCVDLRVLPEAYCSRDLTVEFFGDLPESVDPCGENGEFHTFVFDGPIFSQPLNVRTGVRHREGEFSFCDIAIFEG